MKAIFFDRDGTLIEDQNYGNRIDAFRFLSGVVEGLKKLQSEYEFFIVTNQSGVSRGYSSESELKSFHEFLITRFKAEGISFREIYTCTHLPEAGCECRKPSPMPLLEAARKYKLDLKESWVFGDRATDVQTAKNAQAKGLLLLTGLGPREVDKAKASGVDFVAADFLHAANYLLSPVQKKFLSRPQMQAKVKELRAQEKQIVTLNGSFDIMHSGHEKILKEAKAQGDILLVALNEDASIQKAKGLSRPINPLAARIRMMAAASEVNFVTAFAEPTPIEWLEEIRPHVHVNGSEYGENCIEAPTVKKHGGRIHIVQLEPGISTTQLLSR